MKRVSLFIAGVFIVLLLFAACSSDNASTLCEHEYASTVIKEASYDFEGEKEYVCEKCGDTYTEPIEKLERHVVPTDILDKAVSNAKYEAGILSISIGELVNSAMRSYEVKYISGEEAISKGYLEIEGSDLDVNNLYFAIISGDTIKNPDLPYMSEYEEFAATVWMLFDENDNLQQSGVTVCQSLHNCAILIMTPSAY